MTSNRNPTKSSDGSKAVVSDVPSVDAESPPAATGSPPAESADETDSYLLPADSEVSPTLSVVIPTLNEEEGIGECIDRVENALEELEITGEIVVSDSSDDRTPEIAREKGAIVVVPDEPGYGYAYQYGFARARGEYIAIGDADTTYDFEELPKLFEIVERGDADMAMGSRLDGDILPGSMPKLHKHVGNPLLTKFLNVFYGAGVSDAHSGMRVFTREALDEMDLQTTGMEFASEMIMEAGAKGLSIEEEPITYYPRKGEATLESFSDGWRHVKFMLVNAPGYLFSVPGVVMMGLGVLLMAMAVFDVTLGPVAPGVHSLVAGSLLTLIGQQVSGLGVFAAAASDPIRRPDDPLTNAVVEHVTLERGLAMGAALSGIGGVYAATLVLDWLTTSTLPTLTQDLVAFMLIVLGLQIVFSSFFMGSIVEQT